MNAKIWGLGTLMAISAGFASCDEIKPKSASGPSDASVVKRGDIVPPRVLPPCPPGNCPFAGQSVTVIVGAGISIAGPLQDLKDEFEAATGARLNLVQVRTEEYFDNFFSDVANRVGKYDASIAGAWWLGELVAGNYIISYDKYYKDPSFPKWNIDHVLPASRSLLAYEGRKYMVANDHDAEYFNGKDLNGDGVPDHPPWGSRAKRETKHANVQIG